MGFSYNVNVLNQKGSPALYTDTFANRPSAGYAGRLFIANDTSAIYEDTGTAWVLIANVSSGAGTLEQVTTNGNTTTKGISISAGGLSTNSLTDTALTLGSVLFAGASGLVTQDNAAFFWDDTNNRLGINTVTPTNTLDLHYGGTGSTIGINNTAGNQSAILFVNTGVNKWRIGNSSTNTFDIYNTTNATIAIGIDSGSTVKLVTSPKIKNGTGLSPEAGFGQIGFLTNGVIFQRDNSANKLFFDFSGFTAQRTYLCPDADGTIALTSNLSGYLPLTGGTLTGLLNGTYAIFSGNSSTFGTSSNGGIPLTIQANAVARVLQFLNTLGGTAQILTTGTATTSNIGFNTYSIADAFVIYNDGSAKHQGDLGLWGSATRNLNFYDITNNNINAQIQYSEVNSNTGQLLFKTNNAGTSTTKLTITQSGGVGIGTTTPTFASGSGLQINNASRSNLSLTDGTNTFSIFQQGVDNYINNTSTGDIIFRTTAGNVTRFTISSSGQATFTGILSVNGGTVIDFSGTTCRFYGNTSTNTFALGANNTMYYQGDANQFYPTVDNTRALGTAGLRYTVVYATTALINTSDINEKEQIEELTQLEKNVAIKLKGLIKKFKFKDAVNLKGDKARIHIGVIAQEVKQAFDEEGLNADEYGMFCSDTWYELEGKTVDKDTEGAIEKTRLGIRYEELIIFIISQI